MTSPGPSSLVRRQAARLLALLTLVAVCTPVRGAEPPAVRPIFDCRVPYAPVLAKLRASGGDPAQVLTLRSRAELLRLKSGARYKFSLPVEGRFVVGPEPADAPGNAYSHPILSGGGPVLTAGGIAVRHDGAAVLKVTVDQDSQSYCTTAESLQAALLWLASIGVPPDRLRIENRPPECPEPRPDTWPPVWPVGSRFASPGPAPLALPALLTPTTTTAPGGPSR